MKNIRTKKFVFMITVLTLLGMLLNSCGQESAGSGINQAGAAGNGGEAETAPEDEAPGDGGSAGAASEDGAPGNGGSAGAPSEDGAPGDGGSAGAASQSGTSGGAVLQLEVRFGDQGAPFMMMLEDNETAAAIARYVGTTDWRLPIYEREGDADYEVLQAYDIPSRYDIPSNPETITTAKAGEVYYSDPNRIVLFYHDAEISSEYTRIGTFDATEDFIAAVEDNPVLEGWGNKIILISQP